MTIKDALASLSISRVSRRTDAQLGAYVDGPKQTQNGELIAAARNALPALLAVAEAARGHRSAWRAVVALHDRSTLSMDAERWAAESDARTRRLEETATALDAALRALEDQT